MYEYLQINIILLVLGSLSILLLRTAPSRSKFGIAIATILVWFCPWGIFDIELPYNVVEPFSQLRIQDGINNYNLNLSHTETHNSDTMWQDAMDENSNYVGQRLEDSNDASAAFYFSEKFLLSLFVWASVVGLFLFLVDVYQYWNTISVLNRSARDADHLKRRFPIIPSKCQIKTFSGSFPGMTSGFLHPVIWIRADIESEELLTSIVTHESMHVRANDHKWFWVISFCGRIFWWNPVIYYMTKKARAFIECSCDEKSNKIVPNGEYSLALMKLLLRENGCELDDAIGLGVHDNLTLERIRSLGIVRKLKASHVGVLLGSTCAAAFISFLLAHDSIYEDYFVKTNLHSEQIQEFAALASEEIFNANNPIHRFAHFIKSEQFDVAAADIQMQSLRRYIRESESERIKTLGFRVLAMYLGTQFRYQEIVDIAHANLSKDLLVENTNASRAYAIALMNLGRSREAIDVLEHQRNSGHYRGLSTIVLLAQAYYLNGQFKESSKKVALAWNSAGVPAFPSYHRVLHTLQHFNDKYMREEESQAGSSVFKERIAQINMPKIPHVYAFKYFLDGERIAGFDREAFPLSDKSIGKLPYDVQRELSGILNKSHRDSLFDARAFLAETLKTPEILAKNDVFRVILEHLFIIDIQISDTEVAVDTARRVVDVPGVSRSILARAHWVIAGSTARLSGDSLAHFNAYLEMFDSPTLSVHHEALKRLSLDKVNDASLNDSVRHVEAFYARKNAMPDIQVLNRLILFYRNKNDASKVQALTKQFEVAYPDATNFMFDS